MKSKKFILQAASAKFGRTFKTLREVQIYLQKREIITGEVSGIEAFKLMITNGIGEKEIDASNCVGERSDEVIEILEQRRNKVLLDLSERNTLWVAKNSDPSPCITIFKRSKNESNTASLH